MDNKPSDNILKPRPKKKGSGQMSRKIPILVLTLVTLLFSTGLAFSQNSFGNDFAYKIIDQEFQRLKDGLKNKEVKLIREWIGADRIDTGKGAWKSLRQINYFIPSRKSNPIGVRAIVQKSLGEYAPWADSTTVTTLGDVDAIHPLLNKANSYLADAGMYLAFYQLMDETIKGHPSNSSAAAAFIACLQKGLTQFGTHGNFLAATLGLLYWLTDQSIKGLIKIEHEAVWKKYKAYYDTNYVSSRWINEWESDPKRVLEILKNDFWSSPEADTMVGQWTVKTFEKKYKEIFAYRYFREKVAPILKAHFSALSLKKRNDAIRLLRKAIRELPKRRIILDLPVNIVSANGKPFHTSLNISVSAFSKATGIKTDGILTGTKVELSFPLFDFLKIVSSKKDIVLTAHAENPKGKSGPILLFKPQRLHLDGASLRRDYFQFVGKNATRYQRMRAIKVVVPSRKITVKVEGAYYYQCGTRNCKIEIEGPDGKRHVIDDKGVSWAVIPVIGSSWISAWPSPFGVRVKGSEKGPVTITVYDTSKNPPRLPPKPEFYSGDFISTAYHILDLYKRLEIDSEEAYSWLHDVFENGDMGARSARSQLNSYSMAWCYIHWPDCDTGKAHELYDLERNLNDSISYWKKEKKDIRNAFEETDRKLKNRIIKAINDVTSAIKRLEPDIKSIQKDFNIIRKGKTLGEMLSKPRRFERMSDIEDERKRISSFKEKVQRAASDVPNALRRLDNSDKNLAIELKILESFFVRPGTGFLSAHDLLEKAVGVHHWAASQKVSKDYVSDMAKTYLLIHFTEASLKALENADGNLSWLQLSCLKWLNHVKEYKKFLQRMPFGAKGLKMDMKRLRDIQKELAELRNLSSNGFGVDAYEKYIEIKRIYDPLDKDLSGIKVDLTKWRNKLLELQKRLIDDLKALKSSGWGVSDVEKDIQKALSGYGGDVDNWLREYENTKALMKNADESVSFSLISKKNIDWSRLLNANYKSLDLVKRAQAALKTGDVASAKRLFSQAMTTLSSYPFVGDAIVPIRLQRFNRLQILISRTSEEISRARNNLLGTLNVVISAQGVSPYKVTVTISGNGQTFNQQGPGKFNLAPGRYLATAKGTGIRVYPERQEFIIGTKAQTTIKFQATPAIVAPPKPNIPPVSTGSYDFSNPKTKVIAKNLGLVDQPPMAWSRDGRTLVAILAFEPGLVSIDIKTGGKKALITALPDPPFGSLGGGTNKMAREAWVVGNSVVYIMNLTLWTPSGYLRPVMSVPLTGGKPVKLFSFTSDKQKLLGARLNGQPEFLISGTVFGKKGLFYLKGTSPLVEQAKFFKDLGNVNYLGLSITPDWQLLLEPTKSRNNSYRWKISRLDGTSVYEVSEDLRIYNMTLSPDHAFAAGIQTPVNSMPRIVIIDLSNPKRTWVIASGAINYGVPSWSPDGKYIAARAYRSHNNEELILIKVKR